MIRLLQLSNYSGAAPFPADDAVRGRPPVGLLHCWGMTSFLPPWSRRGRPAIIYRLPNGHTGSGAGFQSGAELMGGLLEEIWEDGLAVRLKQHLWVWDEITSTEMLSSNAQ